MIKAVDTLSGTYLWLQFLCISVGKIETNGKREKRIRLLSNTLTTMTSNTFTLHVKLMTGEYITVELDRDSTWPRHDIKCLIEKADHNLPYYYQTLLHIDPETNEPYTEPTSYTEGTLLLLMALPDVYIKREEFFQGHDPAQKDMTSTRYSIRVYHQQTQRDMFSFLHSPKGFHLFTRAQTHDRKPWSTHIFGKSLTYVDTIEEAVASLPDMIRDVVQRKWNTSEILCIADPLPYTRQASSRHLYDEDYSDDE